MISNFSWQRLLKGMKLRGCVLLKLLMQQTVKNRRLCLGIYMFGDQWMIRIMKWPDYSFINHAKHICMLHEIIGRRLKWSLIELSDRWNLIIALCVSVERKRWNHLRFAHLTWMQAVRHYLIFTSFATGHKKTYSIVWLNSLLRSTILVGWC